MMKRVKHVHVPLDTLDLQVALSEKGFQGGSPSFWVLQVIFCGHSVIYIFS